MEQREFTSFSCQLQVSSASASHFLDAETCELCASSIVVHERPWDKSVYPNDCPGQRMDDDDD